MIPIFVERASASSMECVVKMTALFFLYWDILATTDHMKRLALGSMPAEGSSSKIMGGFPIMQIATDNFLLLPPD